MAAGADHQRLLRDLDVDLECPICMEIFGDPRSLSCGHTFCKTCLEKLVKEQYRPDAIIERYIVCPECRCKDVFSYGETVDNLQRPLTLRKLADVRDKIVHLLDVKSDSEKAPCCDFCEDTSTATHYCFNCILHLCKDCLCQHNEQKAYEEHNVINLDDNLKCQCKRNRVVTTYCQDCQETFCPLCIMKSHPNHMSQEIKMAAVERREILEHELPNFRFKIEKFHALKDTVENLEKTVDVEFGSIDENLQKFEERFISAVRARASEMRARVREIREDEKQKLNSLIDESEDCLSSRLNLIRSMEELLETASDIQVLRKSEDFQRLIENQPFPNIQEGITIALPRFTPTIQPDDLDLGSLVPETKTFPVTEKVAPAQPPKISPKPSVTNNGDSSSSRSRKAQKDKTQKRSSSTPALPKTPKPLFSAPSAPLLAKDRESDPGTSEVRRSALVQSELKAAGDNTRLEGDLLSRVPMERQRKRKIRTSAPGNYSPFRLVSELLNSESSLVKNFKFNTKQHQLYVSTEDNTDPIQVYDYGMQKLGSIGRGVVKDVQQLCIDDVANNVAVIADKGASIKLLNSFGQLKQVTECRDLQKVWAMDFCVDRGFYVVAHQDNTSSNEPGCTGWGISFIDPLSNSIFRKTEDSFNFQSIPNICYISHLETVALSDHCSIKLFDLNGSLIGDLSQSDHQKALIKDTCEGQGGQLILANEDTYDIRALRFGPKGGDYYQYGVASEQCLVTCEQLLGGTPKLVDVSRDGFLAVQAIGKYKPRRPNAKAPLIARLQIFSGTFGGY